MKKLTKKLLLSAITLGLALVTLTTTTFAWYTSSQTASAGNGSAETSSSTNDSSLMISIDGGSTYKRSVNLPTTYLNLIPLQYDATLNEGAGGFKELDNTAAADSEGKYYKFTLHFKTTSNDSANVYISKFDLKNTIQTTGGLTAYDNLVGSNNDEDGIPNADKYAVDVVSALDIVINQTKYNLSSSKFDGIAPLVPKGFDITGGTEVPNSNAYYDAFMGAGSNTKAAAEIYHTGVTDLTTSTIIGTIPEGVDSSVAVTFYIYLNGYDAYCFDACKGQSFTIDLEFTTIAPSAE